MPLEGNHLVTPRFKELCCTRPCLFGIRSFSCLHCLSLSFTCLNCLFKSCDDLVGAVLGVFNLRWGPATRFFDILTSLTIACRRFKAFVYSCLCLMINEKLYQLGVQHIIDATCLG